MTRRHYTLFVLLSAVSTAAASCGKDTGPPAGHEHMLVFEERAVSSSRNHLLVASAAPPASKERQLDAFLALYSLPTGVVYSPQHHRPTSNCTANLGKGSGWLTSSSRLVSAHHVTYPVSLDAARYEVRFGGSAPALTAEGSGGRWLADADTNQYPYDDPNWPALNAVDDNPLVSNRIFQLGMDPWARPGAFGEEARDELEAWEFVIDGNSTGNDFAHQGIMSYTVDPQTGSPQLFGRDIAVLRADGLLEYQELGELEPMFGTFDFTSPAPVPRQC